MEPFDKAFSPAARTRGNLVLLMLHSNPHQSNQWTRWLT